MSEKTAFISYRRDATGKAFARSIKEALTHRGYDVFLDVDTIDSGKWADTILTQVAHRAHFLLLLTPNALDRCAAPTDWMRRKFETARAATPSMAVPNTERDCPDCSTVYDGESCQSKLTCYSASGRGGGCMRYARSAVESIHITHCPICAYRRLDVSTCPLYRARIARGCV
jgi:hypothetical protein